MEEQQENTTEQNSSMEELKIYEEESELSTENIKELSVDDILGTQSLVMSESDEDADKIIESKRNKSPQKKVNAKRSKRLLDSDDDMENKEPEPQTHKEETFINKNKISTLIDSDSDVDQNESKDEEIGTTKNLLDVELTIQKEVLNVKEKVFKNEVTFSKLKKKSNQTVIKSGKSNKSQEKKRSTKLYKNESKTEKNCETNHIPNEMETAKKRISIVDSSDTESESGLNTSDLEASAREANLEGSNNESLSEKTKKSKVVRASAKKAMDEMQAIQSEQQRLHREAHISIPYHKPRKHTLDEFLMRRTIIQPQNASPVSLAIQARSLKMTTEELEEYAKLMEERAKEATEFFKSESENEEEEVFKDNEGVLDNPAEKGEETLAKISIQSLALQNEFSILESVDQIKVTENQNGVNLGEEGLRILPEEEIPQVEDQQERPTCSKVLITEVIELPKLDMNNVTISPVKKHTPRSSLNIKQLLAEKKFSESPSLSGDPSKLIDLETGNLIEKKPSGMENLVKRLMSTVKAKKIRNSETCNILSVENGKLEISKVNVTRSEVKDPQKEAKPGAAYFELKRNLKEIITKKRLEEINKKQEDELEYNKCLADEDEEDETEEIPEEEEYDPVDDPNTEVVLVDEEALEIENDSVETDGEDEEEDEEEEENDEKYDADSEDKEDANEENNDCTKSLNNLEHKHRIISAFDDSDEEEGENDDIDFLKTQPPISQPPLFETQASAKTSLADEESQLIALCSGGFDETQKSYVNALMSQIPITQNVGKPLNDEELMELCSGTFDQPTVAQQTTTTDKSAIHCNKILSSDEENDGEPVKVDPENRQRIKKLTKRLAKKKVKLGFSDDEDDEEEESQCEDDEKREKELDCDDNFEAVIEEPETFVDYDSEENEILVQMTKNDKVTQAQNFFEKEAELSESEWGSADEDENNIDRYDIELGDEDEFDREKLQTELGQIHARKMLDEDIREVRKIQEMFFEDEEKDGVGRQRTFRWKHAESGFSLEDGKACDDNGDDQNGDSGDEINEHQWRKIRYEREQFLKEQGLKPNSQEMTSMLCNTSTPIGSTASIAVNSRKFQIIPTKKTAMSTSDAKKGSPFLISKGISAMHKKTVRGSFLVRDKETLNKLAGLTKGTSSSIGVSDMDDTAGTVSIKSIKPNNFVFATITEEEHENLKRKADDLLNSSNENGRDFMKKPKIEPRRDKCFIDQLL